MVQFLSGLSPRRTAESSSLRHSGESRSPETNLGQTLHFVRMQDLTPNSRPDPELGRHLKVMINRGRSASL